MHVAASSSREGELSHRRRWWPLPRHYRRLLRWRSAKRGRCKFVLGLELQCGPALPIQPNGSRLLCTFAQNSHGACAAALVRRHRRRRSDDESLSLSFAKRRLRIAAAADSDDGGGCICEFAKCIERPKPQPRHAKQLYVTATPFLLPQPRL